MIEHKVPALDYEMVKDFFYKKLDADRHGHGRMESAFFHTAQWVFHQGMVGQAELVARITELETEANILRGALQVHGEESAQLIEQRDELLVALKGYVDKNCGCIACEDGLAAIAKAEAIHA